MLTGKIKVFEVGYCQHPEFMVVKGGRFKQVKFPAMVAWIPHQQGNLLFDTGYSDHFFKATQQFPEKLYALTTPVTWDSSLMKEHNYPVDDIFISHFHADHMSGLKDFPQARFFCSKAAYACSQSTETSRFSKTKKGILPALLPDDFAQRVRFIEDLKKVVLDDCFYPFTEGYEVYEGVFAIALEGHAQGHYGLWLENYFFIADAVWNMKTITENRLPHKLSHLVLDDVNAYYQTIQKLQQLHQHNTHVRIIPTHCLKTLQSHFPCAF